MSEKTIGRIISKKISGLDISLRICFISGIVCGLCAHIYALTNHLYNYDEIWHTPAGIGTGAEHGRWGLDLFKLFMENHFGDVYTIPVINGLITIIMYSLTACIVVKVFKITDQLFAAAVGALFVVFPAVTSRMFFMFTTHPYAIGVFLSSLAALLIIRFHDKWYHIIIAILLLSFGISFYQANFVTAVCITVGYLIIDTLKSNTELTDKQFIQKYYVRCFNYLIFLGCGISLYLLINKLVLASTGRVLSTVEGFDTMGKLSLSNIIHGIKLCYLQFINLVCGFTYSLNPNIFVKLAFLAAFIIFAYAALTVMVKPAPASSKLLILLLMLILPLAVNLIYIMSASSDVMYTIMLYEPVFVFAIACGVIEAAGEAGFGNRKLNIWIHNIYGVFLAVAVLVYIWFANGNYLALEYTNEHDNAYYTVVMTQIKSIEGYRDDMPVIYIGYPSNDSTNNRGSMIGKTFNIGGKADSNLTAYSSHNILYTNLGFNPKISNSDEDEEYFFNHPDVIKMPCYPDDGSIAIIDDTVVVKFDEVNKK